MAHFASQQLVGFLGLFALSDIKEDAEHNPISYVSIIALAAGGNPANVTAGQDSKVDLVGAYYRASSGKSGPDSFQIGGMDILRQDLESDLCFALRNFPQLVCT